MRLKSAPTFRSQSSKASSHFGLDENNKKPIRVFYRYPSNDKGLEVKTERDLCAEIDNAGHPLPFRITTKHLPRSKYGFEIFNEDTLEPWVREKYADKIILKASIAYVTLPMVIRLKHMLMGRYDTLYIVTPVPTGSSKAGKNNSPESS